MDIAAAAGQCCKTWKAWERTMIQIISAIMGYRRSRDFLLIIVMSLFEGFFLIMPPLHDADRRHMALFDAQMRAAVYVLADVAINFLFYWIGRGIRQLRAVSAAPN
jgi:hypothetical protein